MPQSRYDAAIAQLEGSGANLRCSEVKRLLEGLGFTVKDVTAGHRVYSHIGISGFHGANYNCGHGKNPQLLKPYVKNILKTLRTYEAEIRKHLGEGK